MTTITTPTETVVQLSGNDPQGRWILSVLAKRTYQVTPEGRCVLADEQLPLAADIEVSPADRNLVEQDIDLYPWKPATDVIVKGRAFAPRAQRALDVKVRVGRALKTILVLGDRRAKLSAAGRIVFSEAATFEAVPVSYDRAYGGRDRVAEAKYGNGFAALAPFLPDHIDADNQSPYLYPKNPCGRGYLIEATTEAVDALLLPNLEDPLDPLTPDRIVVGDHGNWPWMPMPQALGWTAHGWFPRAALGGIPQDHAARADPVPEVARGLLPADILRPGPQEEKLGFAFCNGAPLELQLPYLAADEAIELTHLHPQQARWTIRLPGERPRISTDGRNGKLNPTEPVIHTVVIEPERSRLSVVWRGSAPALRPYMIDEIDGMPLRVAW